jgi:acetyl-CoA carboxylase carboxyltransferase component
MAAKESRLQDLRELRAKAREGGGAHRVAAQHGEEKHTAERIHRLLDPGSFEEFDMLPREGEDEYLGDGVITATARSTGARW